MFFLFPEVDRRRAALASDTADKNASLVEDAMSVLGRGVIKSADDSRSLDAANFLLGKLLPSQEVVTVEERPADPVSPEDAVRELASALAIAADVIAEGGVSTEAVAMLAEAAARLVAVLPPVARVGRGVVVPEHRRRTERRLLLPMLGAEGQQ